ncbi:hypothetical protein DV736_g5913, partial [Chaetothyriales sp. CBS 134916]
MSDVPLAQRVNQFGLTEVFSHPDPQVDIVLVHGLNGGAYSTWATHKPEMFWPVDLLPRTLEEQRCRVLTYGYDANVTAFTDGTSKDKIHNHAEHLVSRLVANRNLKRALERPIIFICHSLGGLVVKRALIYSRAARHQNLERLRSVYVATYGILFLGTPHTGSDLAKWGSMLERISSAMLPKKFFDSSPQLVNALKTQNETLQNINRLFTEIHERFHIYFFHEGKPMDLKGSREFVVDETSAAPEVPGVERMVIERDHSHMCKFEDDNAPGFDVLAEAVMRYGQDAPKLIRSRWQEEKQIRELERHEMAKEVWGDTTLNPPPFTNTGNSAQESQATSMGAPSKALPAQAASNPDYEIEEVDDLIANQGRDYKLHAFAPGFRPNSLFIGFQLELDELHRKLHSSRRSELGTCSVLVWGEVGSGKTHLTRQYFYKHRQEFPAGSFWVDCRSNKSILNGFWDIGTSIGSLETKRKAVSPPASADHITAVREGLEKLTGWLLVLDSLTFESDEDLDDFKRFIPDESGNFLIITSIDRTLAKRQRLLNPGAVKVRPLTLDEGCELLYKSLGIKKPSAAQQAKALELVKDCQRLPLAIHASAHALIEKGKALERYSRGITDSRITTPFLEILSALREKKYYSAWSLIALLSFYNHYVPVTLIHYGKNGLKNFRGEQVDITTAIHPEGTRQDLDTTIAILMRSGLVERTLQSYPVSGSGEQSPQIARASVSTTQANDDPDLPSKALVRLSEHERLSLLQEEDSSGLGLILAGLESGTERSSASSTTSTIDVLRIHAIVQNVVRDHLKDRKATDGRDFWWWLTAAVHLLTHSYAVANERIKKSSAPGLVRDYREFEIQATRLWSFFPRSPQNASTPLRKSRHELHDLLKMLKQEIQNQSPAQSSDSGQRVIHGSVFDRSSSASEGEPTTPTSDLTRASTWSLDPDGAPYESPTDMRSSQGLQRDFEYGIASDTDSWPSYSDTTEVPNVRSRRSSALRAIFEGRPLLSRKKDLGEWKALPAPPALDVRVAASRPRSSTNSEVGLSGPGSVGSEAEATLIAIHNASPPTSGERRLSSHSRGSISDRLILVPKSTNNKLSPLALTFQPSNVEEAKFGLSSRHHSRTTSSSPRLVQALLANQAKAAGSEVPPPLDLDGRSQIPNRTGLRPINQGQSPSFIPSGYTSLPMSRDNSKEATTGDEYGSKRVSNDLLLRTLSDPQLHDYPQQGEVSSHIDGEWPSLVLSGETGELSSLDDKLSKSDGNVRVWKESEALTFGEMEPVQIEEARERANISRARSAERGQRRRMEGERKENVR